MSTPINLSAIGTKLDNPDAVFYRQSVADLLGRQSLGFPGAQPVSFSRKHFHELREHDYYLCEKTDGTRCLLYCVAIPTPDGDVEAHYLIDRKNDYYRLPGPNRLHLPLHGAADPMPFHSNTLLDGELVRDVDHAGHATPVYYIFDVLAMDGKNIMDRPLDRRLAYATESVARPYRALFDAYPQELLEHPFLLKVKRMEKPYGIEMMFKDVLPNLRHGNDGLIFTCRETSYTPGTDQRILKWKPPHENTIDFRLELVGFPVDEDGDPDYDAVPVFNLNVNVGDKRHRTHAPLSLTPDEWAALKALHQRLDWRIMECYRDAAQSSSGGGGGDVWRPKLDAGSPRFRDDKQDANHVSTVDSVLESIEDAVGREDLLRNAKAISRAWKERNGKREEEVKDKARRAREGVGQSTAAAAAAAAPGKGDEGPSYAD